MDFQPARLVAGAGYLTKDCSTLDQCPQHTNVTRAVAWCARMRTIAFAQIALLAIGLHFRHILSLSPPVWPEVLHAQLLSNRTGNLALVELYYDWPKARNLNLIHSQLDRFGTLWDIEWNNGTSFYFDRLHKTCKSVHFDVGILRPDWLDGAAFLGVETINNFECNVWTKENFIVYYQDADTGVPVRWDFLTTGMSMQVLSWEEGKELPDNHWQAPTFCFDESARAMASSHDVLETGADPAASRADVRFSKGMSYSFLDNGMQ